MNKDSGKGRYTSPDGSATWEYIVAMSCTFLSFCAGCIAGWSSPGLARIMAPNSPVPMTASEASTMMGLLGLGYAVSPVFIVLMADKLGRKKSLLASSIPMIIHWTLIAVAKHPIVIFVARFLGGLAVGLALSLTPMYLGEIASVKLRGALGFLITTTYNAGTLLMFLIVPYVSIRNSGYICSVLALLSGLSLCVIPESPHYLAMIGKIDEAEGALEKLRGKTDVGEELELIKATVRHQEKIANLDQESGDKTSEENTSSYMQLLRVAGTRKALCINFLFILLIQYGGYISTITYGHVVFEAMQTRLPAHICTMIFAGLQLICNILATFLIDRVGRRPLIGIASVVSGGCLLVVGVYFYLMEYRGMDVAPYSIFPLGAIFTYVIAVSIGIVPVQILLLSETFATEVKALATFLIGISGGVTGIISLMAYLTVATTWGFGHSVPYLAFSAVTWISAVSLLRMLPETKGKTLFEIQKDLNA